MTHPEPPRHRPVRALLSNRWLQLGSAILAMIAVANLQYGWTLFVVPIHRRHGWPLEAIQVAFSVFLIVETWLVPLEAYLVDRFGPMLLVAAGGLLVGGGWAINALADSLFLLYLGNGLGGLGTGIVYGTSLGSAIKWFPDRRGLAVGLTAAGFGAGSALTVLPVQQTIERSGYEAAFLWFGIGQGLVVLLSAVVLRAPPRVTPLPAAKPRVQQSSRDYTPLEMVLTPVFWLLYGMMTMVTVGGLMATAQLGPLSHDVGVADAPVPLFGISVAALPLALALDRVLNGITRPFFGWVSDRIGREPTMFVAFALEGLAILCLIQFAHVPVLFVLLSGLTFFAWGEIFSLFPALLGDLFGRRFATTNYGLLYTAKGTASLLVPLGSHLRGATGSWLPIFAVAIALDWITALLALLVLRPMRTRLLDRPALTPAAPSPPGRERR
jgi:OFA family oxalate/formate antiporter-like MFS transporter